MNYIRLSKESNKLKKKMQILAEFSNYIISNTGHSLFISIKKS